MILASQSLCAVHTHAGTTEGPTGKSSRPHFHVGSHHGHHHVAHHTHGNESRGKQSGRPDVTWPPAQNDADHEIDVFHCTDVATGPEYNAGFRHVSALQDFAVAGLTCELAGESACSGGPGTQNLLPLSGIARIPLYVRHSAYRC